MELNSHRSDWRARRRGRAIVATLAATLAAGRLSLAATDTWSNGTGSGSWINPANWADGTTPTSADAVLFPAPGPANNAVVLSSGATVTSATFDNNYSLTGGSLSLPSISVASGKTASIASPLSASLFAKNGDGVLALSGGNTFSGYIDINAGTLRVASDANLGVTANSGIRLTGTLEATGTFSTAKPIYLYGGAIKVAAGQTLTLSANSPLYDTGTFPNYPALYKEGDGTLAIGGYSSRSGATFVNAGTLLIESNGQPGYGMITVGAATLEINNRSYFNNGITVGSASTFRGLGVVSAAITLPSGIDLSPTIASDTSPNGQSPVGGPVGPIAGLLNVTFSGSATSGSILNITGAGTVVPYAPQYLGTYRVNGGTLRLTTSFGSGTSPIEVGDGGTLQLQFSTNRSINLNNNATFRAYGSFVQAPSVVVAAGANVTVGTNLQTESLLLYSPLTGGAGATINAAGPGIVEVNNAQNYTGAWSVSAGTLRVPSSSNGLGVGSSPVVVNGGTLESYSSFARNVMLNSGTLRGNSSGVMFSGTVTIPAGANVALAGAMTLGNGANDLTGGDANTYIHVNGLTGQRVALAQPSNVVGHWLIDGGGIDVPADANLGAASNTITLNRFGTLRTTASATFARDINAQGGTLDSLSNVSSFQSVTGTALTKTGSGTIAIDHIRAGSLSITGGVMQVKPNGTATGVSKLDTIALTGNVQLDLTDNALVMTNTAAGAWNGTAYTGVLGLVAAGCNGGTWDGTHALMTSQSGDGLAALAVVPVESATLAVPNQFRGMSVGATDLLVAYTYAGDADLSGSITGDDYFRIDAGYSAQSSDWINGDFDYSGRIDADDYFIIDRNYSRQGAAFNAGALSAGVIAIPEPALLVLWVPALLLRRKRQN